MISDRDKESKQEAVEILKAQLQTEGQLIGLYEEHERETENKAMKRLMQMFRLDSQRHINILQAAIEIIEGEEVFLEDKKPLAETLAKHLALEKQALDNANKILNKAWVDENKGLKGILELWRDDERRHHKAIKDLTSKPYLRLGSNDMVALFRGEEFLEERYRKAKEFKERHG
jgi:rubrerythrin